jgi:hypothetical protein
VLKLGPAGKPAASWLKMLGSAMSGNRGAGDALPPLLCTSSFFNQGGRRPPQNPNGEVMQLGAFTEQKKKVRDSRDIANLRGHKYLVDVEIAIVGCIVSMVT